MLRRTDRCWPWLDKRTGGYLGWTNGPVVTLAGRTDWWLPWFDERTGGYIGWTNGPVVTLAGRRPRFRGGVGSLLSPFLFFVPSSIMEGMSSRGGRLGFTVFMYFLPISDFHDSRAVNRTTALWDCQGAFSRGRQGAVKDAKRGEIHTRDVPACSSPVLGTRLIRPLLRLLARRGGTNVLGLAKVRRLSTAARASRGAWRGEHPKGLWRHLQPICGLAPSGAPTP